MIARSFATGAKKGRRFGSAAVCKPPASKVALIGLEDDFAAEVATRIEAVGCGTVRVQSVAELVSGGLVFVSGDDPCFLQTICSIRAVNVQARVVVVTRSPAVEKWLNGLDAGASDFFSLPVNDCALRLVLSESSDIVLTVGPPSKQQEETFFPEKIRPDVRRLLFPTAA